MVSHYLINTVQRAILEFTTRCNLRCAYCEKSQPDAGKGLDMPEDILENVISFLINSKINYVCVNGNGETTFFRNWDQYCDRLLDNGCHLGIISNFSKEFSVKELQTLSRFSHIEISCDTADPELFRKLRRGTELSQIIDNMNKVKQTALSLKRPSPQFSWSCLLSDQNIFTIEDYFILGIENGVKAFNICNLVKYPDVENVIPVHHITELPLDKFKKATELLSALAKVLREKNIEVRMPVALAEMILDKYKTTTTSDENPKAVESDRNSYYTSNRPSNSTRDCMEPWNCMFIRSNGSVSPCCVIDKINQLDSSTPINSLVNSPEVINLRYGIYNGELSYFCEKCPNAGWIDIHQFQSRFAK